MGKQHLLLTQRKEKLVKSLQKLSEVFLYKMHLKEGLQGFLSDILLDDESWNIRYFVADMYPWRNELERLVSVFNFESFDHLKREMIVKLDKTAIEQLPRISEDLSVYLYQSKVLEDLEKAGLPLKRKDSNSKHQGAHQSFLGHVAGGDQIDEQQGANPHLRSFRELRGYRCEAFDGEVGFLEDCTYNIRNQKIFFFESRGFNDELLKLNPDWVSEIQFSHSVIKLHLPLTSIRSQQDPSKWKASQPVTSNLSDSPKE